MVLSRLSDEQLRDTLAENLGVAVAAHEKLARILAEMMRRIHAIEEAALQEEALVEKARQN